MSEKESISEQVPDSKIETESKKMATSEEMRILSHILALYQDATRNELNRLIGSIFEDYQENQQQAHHQKAHHQKTQPTLGELLGVSDEQALLLIQEEVAKSIQEQAPAHIIRALTKALRPKQNQPPNQT